LPASISSYRLRVSPPIALSQEEAVLKVESKEGGKSEGDCPHL